MKKIIGITFIQIIAALMIVNYHTSIINIPILSKIAKFGFIFNTVFIFLSGFLLTHSLSKIATSEYRDFIYKRFNRIYPSFHIALFLITLIYLLMGIDFTINSLLLSATGFAYYFGDNIFGPHLWFVSVILVCYLLAIPTYHALKRYPFTFFIIFLLFILIIVFILEKTFDGIYYKISDIVLYRFLYHYFVFSLAIYIGIQKNRINFNVNAWKLIGVFIIAFLIYFVTHPEPKFSILTVISALIIAISLIQIFITISPFLEKYFSYLLFLSPITYEIYLIHYSVLTAIDSKYHGEYFAYPMVFIISILLAFLILLISKQYRKLLTNCRKWILK